MFKKTIKYVDFDNNDREEDFYFNLTKAEVAEMELSENGGISKLLQKIIAEKDQKRIVEFFKDFIIRSYGEKSNDGRRFMKSKEITDAFTQTEAYSILFMELATDEGKAAEFVNAVIPTVKAPTANAVPLATPTV